MAFVVAVAAAVAGAVGMGVGVASGSNLRDLGQLGPKKLDTLLKRERCIDMPGG